MRERIQLGNMTQQTAAPLIGATPINQFAPAARGNVSELQQSRTEASALSMLSDAVVTGARGVEAYDKSKEVARKAEEERMLQAYNAAVKASRPAVVNKLKTEWLATEQQQGTQDYGQVSKAFGENANVKSILGNYSRNPKDSEELFNTFLSEKEVAAAKVQTDNFFSDTRASIAGQAVDTVQAAIDDPKQGAAYLDDAIDAMKKAGGTGADVYKPVINQINQLISTGELDDVQQAVAMVHVLSTRGKDLGEAAPELQALMPKLQKAYKSADDEAYRKENDLHILRLDELVKSGDVESVRLDVKEGMEHGYYNDKQAAAYISKANQQQARGEAVTDQTAELLSGRKVAASVHVTGDLSNAMDDSISKKYLAGDEQTGWRLRNDSTGLALLKGMAYNDEVKLTKTTARLFGGIDAGSIGMAQGGAVTPHTVQSFNNLAMAEGALGDAQAKKLVGTERWQVYSIAKAVNGNVFTPESFARIQPLMRNLETIPKRTLTSREQRRLEDAVETATGWNSSQTREALRANSDVMDMALRASNYDMGLASNIYKENVSGQYGEIDGQHLYGAGLSNKYIKDKLHTDDTDEAWQGVLKDVATKHNLPEDTKLQIVSFDKLDNSVALVTDGKSQVFTVSVPSAIDEHADKIFSEPSEDEATKRANAATEGVTERNKEQLSNPYVQRTLQAQHKQ